MPGLDQYMKTTRDVLGAVLLSALVGCATDSPTDGGDGGGGGTGSVMVTATTTGTDADADGYTATIGTTDMSVGANGSATFTGVATGSASVALSGVAANCSVTGSNPVSVTVAEGQTANATFAVTCLANVGSIEVTTATTGTNTDPNGYSVAVDGGTAQTIGVNASLTLSNLGVGSRSVHLSGVAANCTVSGGNPRTVSVSFGATATAAFAVACVGPPQIYFTTHRDGNGEIYVMDADGSSLQNLTTNGSEDFGADASATGGALITFVSNRDGDLEVYSMAPDGTGVMNLTNNSSADAEPMLSPDGTRIAFTTDRDGNFEVYTMNVDGSNLVNVTNNPAADYLPRWSPDGTKLAFVTTRDSGNQEIYTMNANGTSLLNVTNNSADDFHPAWSPDGLQIAFVTTRDGNREIYTMSSSGSGLTRLTNNSSADEYARWKH